VSVHTESVKVLFKKKYQKHFTILSIGSVTISHISYCWRSGLHEEI